MGLSLVGLSLFMPAEGFKNKCDYCGRTDLKCFRCSGCESARYCSRKCQKKAWPNHKELCSRWQNFQGLLSRGSAQALDPQGDPCPRLSPNLLTRGSAQAVDPLSEGSDLTDVFMVLFRHLYLRNPDQDMFDDAVRQLLSNDGPGFSAITHMLHELNHDLAWNIASGDRVRSTYVPSDITPTRAPAWGSAQSMGPSPTGSSSSSEARGSAQWTESFASSEPWTGPEAPDGPWIWPSGVNPDSCSPSRLRELMAVFSTESSHRLQKAKPYIGLSPFRAMGLTPPWGSAQEEPFEGDVEWLSMFLDVFAEGYE